MNPSIPAFLHNSFKLLIFLLGIVGPSCSARLGINEMNSTNRVHLPGSNHRVAAEWEPALGTMITWPLSIPYKLVVELSRDCQLYTLVENEAAKKEATRWYTSWGIDSTRNTFLFTPQGLDAWWVRDWGPGAVFSPDRKMRLADGKYIFSTPVTKIQCHDTLEFLYQTADHQIIKTETDDQATTALGRGLNLELLDLPFINTGGNVALDGLGTAFSTCILENENKFYGISSEQFLRLNKELLGIHTYHILPNFEFNGIQHIDCFLKLLDEERILVAEPPRDHPLYTIYESILQNELVKLKTAYNRPYQIHRLKTGRYTRDRLAAYTNSLILNKTIYVPLFNIKEDAGAMNTWREVMPGYTVKGFQFDLKDEPVLSQKMKEHYRTYGWQDGDALHCRTRAVWDPHMVFISVKRLDRSEDANQKHTVFATIIDYSNSGLQKDKCQLHWKLSGTTAWNTVRLKNPGTSNQFAADIPFHQSGSVIEYYISATSFSGKTETQPRTAPQGTYSFSIH